MSTQRTQSILKGAGLLLVLMLAVSAFFPGIVEAKPNKIGVCHLDESGAYELKFVPEQAVNAHMGHGDVLPRTEGLDESCTPLPDNDGDGIPDVDDTDDDNDGQSDADETACGSDPLDAGTMAADFDGDSSPDCVDPDDDNDGVNDVDDAFPFDPTRSDPLSPGCQAANIPPTLVTGDQPLHIGPETFYAGETIYVTNPSSLNVTFEIEPSVHEDIVDGETNSYTLVATEVTEPLEIHVTSVFGSEEIFVSVSCE